MDRGRSVVRFHPNLLIFVNFCKYFFFRFHSAGQGARVVTSGIPRVKELLFMSKKIKTPSTTIFVSPELAQNESFLFKWTHLLKELYLEDVLIPESVEILWDPDPHHTTSTKECDITIVRLHSIFHEKSSEPYPHSRWVIRAQLDKNALVDRGLTPKDIARVVRRHMNFSNGSSGVYQNIVIASETHMEDWILRFRIPDVHQMVQESSGDEKTRQTFERDLCLRILYELSRTVRISGIAGITGATVRQEFGHTIIDTKGSNMLDLWMLDGLDWTKTVSNVLYEVQEFLGIEAATEMLFYELKTVMTMASANISDRHLLILMDVMTRHGYLIPINRHGFNRLNHALARAAFEETVENLMEAAMFAEVDPMRDIVSNLAVGQTVPAGTGRVHTMVNAEYVRKAQIDMAQAMPVKEDEVIFTHVHPSLRDVIEKSSRGHSSSHSGKEDPLSDWIPPEHSDEEGASFFQAHPSSGLQDECIDVGRQSSYSSASNSMSSFFTSGGVNRRFATYSYFLETEENNDQKYFGHSECKLPAYRPSSPKSSSEREVGGLPVRKKSYRPSSPPSSQDSHLSPRGMVGERSSVFRRRRRRSSSENELVQNSDDEDENFVVLPEEALCENIEIMETTYPDPMFTPLTTCSSVKSLEICEK